MKKTDDKQIAAVKKHQAKMYRLPVFIRKELREPLLEIAVNKGYKSLNSYAVTLMEKDSGLTLK